MLPRYLGRQARLLFELRTGQLYVVFAIASTLKSVYKRLRHRVQNFAFAFLLAPSAPPEGADRFLLSSAIFWMFLWQSVELEIGVFLWMDFPKPASEVRAPRDPSRKSRSSNLPVCYRLHHACARVAVEMHSVLATGIVARIEAPLLTRSSEPALGYTCDEACHMGKQVSKHNVEFLR